MRWSNGYIFTTKETPAEAEIPSHILLLRGGYLRKLAPGIFTYGPLLLRSIRKFEDIVRQELNSRGCHELLMPMVHPKELWQETGRWEKMAGVGLLRLKNRNNQEFCLGATHEEAITDWVRHDIKSYRDLPVTLYQIQTKFRDEIRPRFGLMRGREFIMKDAYSFDKTTADAQKSYQKLHEAYSAIFKRLGVNFAIVKADSGSIGGDQSEEFHLLASSGEDRLLVSEDGKFAANVEVCPALDAGPLTASAGELLSMETFATPGLKTIADLAKFLKVKDSELVKTMFFSASDDPSQVVPVAVLLRGSDEVNPIKLKNRLGLSNPPMLLTDEEVLKVTGAHPGSCGPVGLKIPIYMDQGVQALRNYVVGANKDGFHIKNVNHDRDYKVTQVADLRFAKAGDKNPQGAGVLKEFRGIEVGHVFYLGTVYSKPMNANYLDVDGQLKPIEMGCYGIGVTRTVQAAVEQNHDKDGIIWPLAIAPYSVHICLLDPEDSAAVKCAEKLYQELWSEGVDCLLDDRQERPGVKFKDADLLGMPLRVVIGARGLATGEVELVERQSKAMKKIAQADVRATIVAWVRERMPRS